MKFSKEETAVAKAVGNRIREARKAKKVSACDLADKMTELGFKMNQDGVLRIEKGIARLPFSYSFRIFDLLKIEIEEFRALAMGAACKVSDEDPTEADPA